MPKFRKALRIGLIGAWIFATIPIIALCGLVQRSIDWIDDRIGVNDSELLDEPATWYDSKF